MKCQILFSGKTKNITNLSFAERVVMVKKSSLICWCLMSCGLTLKAPITTKADNNFYFFYFLKKTSLNISCESSALADDSHEMSRLFFSERLKIKILECHLLQILLGVLRVKTDIEVLVCMCLLMKTVT